MAFWSGVILQCLLLQTFANGRKSHPSWHARDPVVGVQSPSLAPTEVPITESTTTHFKKTKKGTKKKRKSVISKPEQSNIDTPSRSVKNVKKVKKRRTKQTDSSVPGREEPLDQELLPSSIQRIPKKVKKLKRPSGGATSPKKISSPPKRDQQTFHRHNKRSTTNRVKAIQKPAVTSMDKTVDIPINKTLHNHHHHRQKKKTKKQPSILEKATESTQISGNSKTGKKRRRKKHVSPNFGWQTSTLPDAHDDAVLTSVPDADNTEKVEASDLPTHELVLAETPRTTTASNSSGGGSQSAITSPPSTTIETEQQETIDPKCDIDKHDKNEEMTRKHPIKAIGDIDPVITSHSSTAQWSPTNAAFIQTQRKDHILAKVETNYSTSLPKEELASDSIVASENEDDDIPSTQVSSESTSEADVLIGQSIAKSQEEVEGYESKEQIDDSTLLQGEYNRMEAPPELNDNHGKYIHETASETDSEDNMINIAESHDGFDTMERASVKEATMSSLDEQMFDSTFRKDANANTSNNENITRSLSSFHDAHKEEGAHQYNDEASTLKSGKSEFVLTDKKATEKMLSQPPLQINSPEDPYLEPDVVQFIGQILDEEVEEVRAWTNDETSSGTDSGILATSFNETRGGSQIPKNQDVTNNSILIIHDNTSSEKGETMTCIETINAGQVEGNQKPIESSQNALVVDEQSLFTRTALETCEDKCTDATVSIVTWNLAEESPSEEDALFIRAFRNGVQKPGEGSDLILVSGQECENIKPRRTEGRRSREYRRLMIKMLGRNYVPIALHMLGGIQFGLFAKKTFLKDIEQVSVADVTCGIGNVFHNKGAIAAFVQVKARNPRNESNGDLPRSKSLRMVFVTAHMAAHVKNSEARDADFWRISSELEAQIPRGFLPIERTETSSDDRSFLFDSVDRAFFCGDLNYRIDLPREIVEYSILKGDKEMTWSNLLKHDQLFRTMTEGTAFPGFVEGKITFAPTFKFDKETGDYDTSHKQRIPAWTDRILFKPWGTRVMSYDCVPGAQHSDHRPVYGTFRVNMEGRELPPAKKRRKGHTREPSKIASDGIEQSTKNRGIK